MFVGSNKVISMMSSQCQRAAFVDEGASASECSAGMSKAARRLARRLAESAAAFHIEKVKEELMVPISEEAGTVRLIIERSFSPANPHVFALAVRHKGKMVDIVFARNRRMAKGCACIISLDKNDFEKKQAARGSGYVGKLRCSASGQFFTLYDNGFNGTKDRVELTHGSQHQQARCEYASVMYFEYASVLRDQRMMVAVPTISKGETRGDVWRPFHKKEGMSYHHRELAVHGPFSRLHEAMMCFNCVDDGEVDTKSDSQASVKNFKLVMTRLEGTGYDAGYGSNDGRAARDVILSLQKQDRRTFQIEVRHPLSVFQAFGICLSRFHASNHVRARANRVWERIIPSIFLSSSPRRAKYDA